MTTRLQTDDIVEITGFPELGIWRVTDLWAAKGIRWLTPYTPLAKDFANLTFNGMLGINTKDVTKLPAQKETLL